MLHLRPSISECVSTENHKTNKEGKKISENNFWKVVEGGGQTFYWVNVKNTLRLEEDVLNSKWWIAGS